jgi:hypothetical protein
VTAIYTTPRIAHLIAAGKVVQHRAPIRASNGARLPFHPGHAQTVRAPNRPALCRVVVVRTWHVALGELSPRDLHETGHASRLDLARWWMRDTAARWLEREGEEMPADLLLARFEKGPANDVVWGVTFELDRSHEPRLLHEDPAQGYTHLPEQAATAEPEAVPAYVVEREVEPARARHAAARGLLEQQALDEVRSLEARLTRLRERARATGVDIRPDLRVIEQRIHRAEQRTARAA